MNAGKARRMRAVAWPHAGAPTPEPVEIAAPEPGPGEVLVRVK